jgi:glucose-6-phosphate 1-dehydrogenase
MTPCRSIAPLMHSLTLYQVELPRINCGVYLMYEGAVLSQDLAPTILVIFGVSGDLAQRYLLPSLAAIHRNGGLPANFKLLGITRQSLAAKDILEPNCRGLEAFSEIQTMNLSEQADYAKLRKKLADMSKQLGQGTQIIFYFAVPPTAVLPIIRHLGQAELNHKNTKLLLEKPFGTDVQSAADLIRETNQHYAENQVYRIDHYLAKGMAQNITVFLGGNVLFRNVWNKEFISRIDIIASEKIDIEGRLNFYEQSGALRDLVQSHLLQLAALVLMKPCTDLFDFSEVPARRLAALKQLELSGPPAKAALRAQYEGYRKEVTNPKSMIETFVELKLESTDERWGGVPIRLITGKALDKKFTEIRVHFKKTQASESNRLTLRIQPNEGIELELWVKKPGYDQDLAQLPLAFNYEKYFGTDLPDAYEQVIVDAIRTRSDLFASSAEVLASWTLLDPVLKNWAMNESDLKFYKKGTNYKDVVSQV